MSQAGDDNPDALVCQSKRLDWVAQTSTSAIGDSYRTIGTGIAAGGPKGARYACLPVLTASMNWVSALATQSGTSMNSMPAR